MSSRFRQTGVGRMSILERHRCRPAGHIVENVRVLSDVQGNMSNRGQEESYSSIQEED